MAESRVFPSLGSESSCQQTASSLSSWFLSPKGEVADKRNSLDCCSKGLDFVGHDFGEDGYSYTSWASLPHSYVASGLSTANNARYHNDYSNKLVAEIIQWAMDYNPQTGTTFIAFTAANSDASDELTVLWSRLTEAFPEVDTGSTSVKLFYMIVASLSNGTYSAETLKTLLFPDKPTTSGSEKSTKTAEEYELYTNVLPLRSVHVSSCTSQLEYDASFSYSQAMMEFKERLEADGTILEVAAPLRLACMAASVCPSLAKVDSTPYRFVRGLKNVKYISTSFDLKIPAHTEIIAMNLETYLRYMSGKITENVPSGFEAGDADILWTAIPITPSLLGGGSAAVPYIASFLHSNFWAGSINHQYSAECEYTTSGLGESYAYFNLMPSANSVLIPGPTRCVLVLQDHYTESVRIGSLQVPVWSHQANMTIPQFGTEWAKFWNDSNLSIMSAITVAQNEISNNICLGMSSDVARALAADLSTAMYPGIMAQCKETAQLLNEVALGAWKINPYNVTTDAEALASRSSIKAKFVNISNEKQWGPDKISRWICGFNMSSLTATHCCQAGFVNTRRDADTAGSPVYWSGNDPQCQTAYARVPTLTSQTRVSVCRNLWNTPCYEGNFHSQGIYTKWLHMLAFTLSLSTANFLTCNNLRTKQWAGFNTDLDHDVFDIFTAKASIFKGVINHSDCRQMHERYDSVGTCIFEYYQMDPFDSEDWYSHSPVAYPFLNQWRKTMNEGLSGENSRQVNIHLYKIISMASPLDKTLLGRKNDLVGTIDMETYRTIIVKLNYGEHSYGNWYEQEQYITISASNVHARKKQNLMCSLSTTVQANEFTFVLGSYHMRGFTDMRSIETSLLRYPEKPEEENGPINAGTHLARLTAALSRLRMCQGHRETRANPKTLLEALIKPMRLQ